MINVEGASMKGGLMTGGTIYRATKKFKKKQIKYINTETYEHKI